MQHYIEPSPRILALIRLNAYPDLEADIQRLSLPDGHRDAARIQVRVERRMGRKVIGPRMPCIVYPWLMSDFFK